MDRVMAEASLFSPSIMPISIFNPTNNAKKSFQICSQSQKNLSIKFYRSPSILTRQSLHSKVYLKSKCSKNFNNNSFHLNLTIRNCSDSNEDHSSTTVFEFNKPSSSLHFNSFNEKCNSNKRINNEIFMLRASASSHEFEETPALNTSQEVAVSTFHSFLNWINSFCKFSRPHTVLGTFMSVISVSILALNKVSDLNLKFIYAVLQAVTSAILMNVYIVGLNQLYDIECDKLNKPYLPLASGEYSVNMGIIIITSCAFLSLSIGLYSNSYPLLFTLLISMLLGTVYSVDLPFLRWKRFPFLAAACIFSVRAVIVQLGFYSHIKLALNKALSLNRCIIFATSFMFFFSIVIALFKDIPDVEGDRIFGIRSFSVRLGQKKVYEICIFLLLASYLCTILFAFTSKILWSQILTIICHSLIGWQLWKRSKDVEFGNKNSVYDVYMFVWKLFYLEYFLLPFIR